MNRRVVAAEWLLFWACVALGLTAVPVLLGLLAPSEDGVGAFVGMYYGAVFGSLFGPKRGYSLFMLFLVLSPYLLFQWSRSVVWAVQTLRGKA